MEIDVSLRKCYYNNNLYDLKYLENEVRTMSSLDKQIDFTEHSCREFIDVLASSAPIPGGGGASALVGAIGVALGNMVGSLTVGKKRYADVEEDIYVDTDKICKLDQLHTEILELGRKLHPSDIDMLNAVLKRVVEMKYDVAKDAVDNYLGHK